MDRKAAKFFVVFLLLPLFFLSGCLLDRYHYYTSVRGTPGSISAVAVHKGDNIYRVAKRYDVTLRDLIEVNNLKPPYRIHPGQALRLPKKRIHIVRRFETVTSIARKRNVDIHGLVKMNDLQAPYTLRENQRLQLPYPQKAQPHWARRKIVAKKIEPIKKIEPLLPLKEKAKTIEPLLPLVKKPTLKKPSPNREAHRETQKTFKDIFQVPPPQKPQLVHTAKTPSQKRVSQKEPKLALISKFSWPLRGRILAKYGKKSGGLRNDGVNIAAKKGTPIKAAEQGHVVYVGNALKGYGKLILIRHRGGWITTYAHCDRTFISKGDPVKKGQKIATVGSTGNVKKSQLHFEVRKKTRTVDPLRYLG